MNDTIASIFLWFIAILVLGSPVWAWVILKILHKPRVEERLERLKPRFIRAIGWLLGLFLVLFVLWWLLPDDWKLKYEVQYWVSTDQIVIERKPHNCEWGSAPLGDKHCHYRAVVTRYNYHGEVIIDGETTNKLYVGWERIDE